MKKIALAAVAVALAGLMATAGPALAQNRNNSTQIFTSNSAFFGFVPTPANIDTFMQKDVAASCTAPCDFQFNTYVKNNQMPGAYTARPDKAVTANPDFGCGTQVTSGSACLETVMNLEDRVNGNTTTANLGGGGGNGQNTAPTTANGTGGPAGPSGVLVGDLTSEVYMESVEDGMPSGSVVFSRTDGTLGSIEVDFDQTVTTSISGFQDFTEHDYTLAPFEAILCVAPDCPVGATVFPAGALVGNRTSGALPGHAHSGLGIRADLSLSQPSMGGEGTGTEAIGYSVDWQGDGMYPTPGAYFTPGLNVGDWVGSTAPDNNGFPN